MRMRSLFLGCQAPEGLERPVSSMIRDILSMPVRMAPSPLVLSGYSPVRDQYDATSVLTVMDTFRRRYSPDGPVLLVTGGDLFMEGARTCSGSPGRLPRTRLSPLHGSLARCTGGGMGMTDSPIASPRRPLMRSATSSAFLTAGTLPASCGTPPGLMNSRQRRGHSAITVLVF